MVYDINGYKITNFSQYTHDSLYIEIINEDNEIIKFFFNEICHVTFYKKFPLSKCIIVEEPELIEKVLLENYGRIPSIYPHKIYQFLDIKGNIALKLVAEALMIINMRGYCEKAIV